MDDRVALVGRLFMAYQSGELVDPAALAAIVSPDVCIEPAGQGVLAIGSIRAASADGFAAPMPTAWAFEFDGDDRLVRMRAYLDVAEARASLG